MRSKTEGGIQMEKRRLSAILAKSDRHILSALAAEIQANHRVAIVKGPNKALAMIQMREPVRQGLFYLGEVIVSEAVAELEGVKGVAVAMGDDTEKVLHMAVIDAAVNKGVFTEMDTLLALEKEQTDRAMRENAIHLKTMVRFESMDAEAPNDDAR
jgi:alpha-D-ribose 1-methylphosphonate 5-triphosphate synthase subunit PhnG